MLDQLIGGGLLKSVGAIIDSVHTSEDEKNNAKITRSPMFVDAPQ